MVEEGQNECPNPESHSSIFHRLPIVLKLRLVPGIPQRITSTARMMNIGLLGVLNRNVQREFDTSRKETIGPAEAKA
jgi:hypothetical protein